MTDPLPTWPAFAASVRSRLEAGAREYGDASFSRPPGELLAEIQEELADVCGWAFILHSRIERLRLRCEPEAVPILYPAQKYAPEPEEG